MPRLSLATFALLSSALLVACGDKEAGDDTAGGSDASAGADLYSTNCVSCHGENGLGEEETGYTDASNLNEVVPTMSEEEIVTVILGGQGSMPQIGVSEAEAADIAAYVKAEFGS